MRRTMIAALSLCLLFSGAAIAAPDEKPEKAVCAKCDGDCKCEKAACAKCEGECKCARGKASSVTILKSGPSSSISVSGWESMSPEMKKKIIDELSKKYEGDELKRVLEALKKGGGTFSTGKGPAPTLIGVGGSIRLQGAPGKPKPKVEVEIEKVEPRVHVIKAMPEGRMFVTGEGDWSKLPEDVRKEILESMKDSVPPEMYEKMKKAIESGKAHSFGHMGPMAGRPMISFGGTKPKTKHEVHVRLDGEQGGKLPPEARMHILHALEGKVDPKLMHELKKALARGESDIHIVREGATPYRMPGMRRSAPMPRQPRRGARRGGGRGRFGPGMMPRGRKHGGGGGDALLEAIQGLRQEVHMLRRELAAMRALHGAAAPKAAPRSYRVAVPKLGVRVEPPKKPQPPKGAFYLRGAPQGGAAGVRLRTAMPKAKVPAGLDAMKSALQDIKKMMGEFQRRLSEIEKAKRPARKPAK